MLGLTVRISMRYSTIFLLPIKKAAEKVRQDSIKAVKKQNQPKKESKKPKGEDKSKDNKGKDKSSQTKKRAIG